MKSRKLTENEINKVAIFLTKEIYDITDEKKELLNNLVNEISPNGDFTVDDYIKDVTEGEKMGSDVTLDYINSQKEYIKDSISFAVDTDFGTYISITNFEIDDAVVDKKLENTLFLGEGFEAEVLTKSVNEILITNEGEVKLLNFSDIIGIYGIGDEVILSLSKDKY